MSPLDFCMCLEPPRSLQVTQRLSHQPRWPEPELDTLSSDLGPQLLLQWALHVVRSFWPHAQAYIHAFATEIC